MELAHEANALFVDEAYVDAIDAYTQALAKLSAKTRDRADVFAKRAAAYLKVNKWSEAVVDADSAIELDSTLEMAHLRKGCGLRPSGIFSTSVLAYACLADMLMPQNM